MVIARWLLNCELPGMAQASSATRATAGRDGHSGRRFRTYLTPMRGSALELRGDSEMSEIAVCVSWH
jgi:hypothetical protein